MEQYLFPFKLIDKDAKVILYGAGNVGKQFYNQIVNSEYCKVVLWVDKKWNYYAEMGYPVFCIDKIVSAEYDHIVLAIQNEDIARLVKEELITDRQIRRDKIVWQDYGRMDNVITPLLYTEAPSARNECRVLDPIEVVNSDCMEHMVRYLLSKDIVDAIQNQKHLSLYQRFCMTSTSACEVLEGETGFFSEYTQKKGLDNYLKLFKDLIASMEKEGFLKDHFLPLGNNGYLINGKHRYAAALALEKKIWVKTYDMMKGHNKDLDWFRNNGFTNEDLTMILRAFCDVYKRCGIYLLYGPVMEYWDYITVKVKEKLKLVGYVDMDFTNDYIGFMNLLRDNYWDNEQNLLNIEQKIHFLLMGPLKVRVLVVSDEQLGENTKKRFYHVMKDMKNELRTHMLMDTAKHTVIMHGSDSKEEFDHMKNLWLSVNNIRCANVRVLYNYGNEFVNMLRKFREYLKLYGIPIDEICILGSAGMELYGLRCADDIDFCVSSGYREQIVTDKLPKNVNLKRINSLAIAKNEVYTDDMIINNPDFYYMFYGFKFINLELLYKMKKFRKLEKDIEDIRLLEIFFDSVKAFDDRLALRRQMERELRRRY